MTSDIRRHWHVALATLLIWCAAGPLGSIVQAADENPAQMSDAESRALADRLDALVEQAAERVGQPGAEGGAPGAEVIALRGRLEAAEAQIALLKNVVIQALRAQSAAEEALRRAQGTASGASDPELARDPVEAPDLMLADQLEALTETVQRLRAEVDALRGRGRSEPAEPDAGSAMRQSSPGALPQQALEEPAVEEDAMLADSGVGGRYEPLLENEAPSSGPSDFAAVRSGDSIEVAQVHFNLGSAELTPSGERKTLEAAERIRSMEPAKVRVVAFADRVGGAAYNRVLSQERALSVAAVLESVGLPRDMVEVVGSGEEGIPEPTADGVPEPLNRCAGIFVLANSAAG
ncbi:MAG TPA: OmpA family protein [Geminicoccaceae bacterium]|nr:OmpA family protein [Geminicoccaceae bacterium]